MQAREDAKANRDPVETAGHGARVAARSGQTPDARARCLLCNTPGPHTSTVKGTGLALCSTCASSRPGLVARNGGSAGVTESP